MSVFVAAATSMLRVLLVILAGVASERAGLLGRDQRKAVAKLSASLFLPCLIVTKVVRTLDAYRGNLTQVFWLPLYCAAHIGLNHVLISLLLALFLRKRLDRVSRVVVWIGATFPNSGALPLALVDSLCRAEPALLAPGFEEAEAAAHCDAVAVGYVSLYIMVQFPLMYILVPRALLRSGVDEGKAKLAAADSAAHAVEVEVTPAVEETCAPPAAAPAATSPPPQPRPQRLRAAARHLRDLVLQRKPGLPPPVLAAALGLIVGGLPFLSSAFIGDGAPLRSTVTDAAELLARAAVPISTINLGASLSAGQRAGGLAKGLRPVAVASAATVRLLVAPAVSIAASVALRQIGALPADRLLLLVLMIEAAPPPAMQLMVLVQLFEQAAERPLGTLLAFLYPASLVTLTLWIAGILQIVPWIA